MSPRASGSTSERKADAVDDDESTEPGYGLVMPFVAVKSKGGPFDDDAYCAGYEMGKLDEELGSWGGVTASGDQMIRTANAEQADLIAMRHGFATTITEQADGWSWLEFRQKPEAHGDV